MRDVIAGFSMDVEQFAENVRGPTSRPANGRPPCVSSSVSTARRPG